MEQPRAPALSEGVLCVASATSLGPRAAGSGQGRVCVTSGSLRLWGVVCAKALELVEQEGSTEARWRAGRAWTELLKSGTGKIGRAAGCLGGPAWMGLSCVSSDMS